MINLSGELTSVIAVTASGPASFSRRLDVAHEPSVLEYLNWDNQSLRNCFRPCPCRAFAPPQPGCEIVDDDARSGMAQSFHVRDVLSCLLIIVSTIDENDVEGSCRLLLSVSGNRRRGVADYEFVPSRVPCVHELLGMTHDFAAGDIEGNDPHVRTGTQKSQTGKSCIEPDLANQPSA